MDRKLTPHFIWAGFCVAAVSLMTGCQLPQINQTKLPTPASTIDTSSLEKVRFQSPGGALSGNDNRVVSRLGLGELPAAGQEIASGIDTTGKASDRIADVVIQGNRTVPTHQLKAKLRTRPGRFFDPDRLQQDVNDLWRMPEIKRVKGPFLSRSEDGITVTLEVVERPVITKVEFIGNRGIPDRTLKKETGLEDGRPLDVHQIRMAKSRLEDLYKEKGYPRTQVEIMEGSEASDSSVVFLIHEDEQQRIWKVNFEGNSIASDARLRHFIKSKPGILKVIGGLVNRDQIEQDITRLTSYYRSLGFFNARIGREISESNDGRWLTLRFIINEGPRYRVRNVSFNGNQVFTVEQLATLVELKPQQQEAPEFNVAKMNQDVAELRELYGSEGFVFAQVEAQPRFLEEPGLLDIVYQIKEGKQYVVGDINIHFEGGGAITKREVVLARLSLRPGDLVNANEIRNSERRLRAAQVFAVGGADGGAPPRIVVKPPELDDLLRFSEQERGVRNAGYVR